MAVASNQPLSLRVAELFAGVGGFRLGLEGCREWGAEGVGMQMVWANQWEPPGNEKKQFAWACYEARFGAGSCVNEDIEKVLDLVEHGAYGIPDFDLLCAGFPCQDYSVAKPSPESKGMEGKKGVLWWQIVRLLQMKRPEYVLLENVDRLLKSPSSQRGRDFAVILSCLNELGYLVEWRVVDASAYGFPQRRKRVFIYGEQAASPRDLQSRLLEDGVIARAFPALIEKDQVKSVLLEGSVFDVSLSFGANKQGSAFMEAGVMQNGSVLMASMRPNYRGPFATLGDVLVPEEDAPASFYIEDDAVSRWVYLKGAKQEQRVCKRNGHAYVYSEGKVTFPDALDAPSRTILTSEGGASASRTKHVIQAPDGRLRRLLPVELERLSGFPDGWTDTGMTDAQRAFCIGNALVVGVVERIGLEIADRASQAGEFSE